MKITAVSHRFPTKLNPAQGKIIKDELDLIKDNVNLSLVIPAVKAPFFLSQSDRASDLIDVDYPILRAPYWSVPRRKFPSVTQKQISQALLKVIPKETDIVHLHWIHPSGLTAKTLKKAGYTVFLSIHGSDWTKNYDKNYFKPLIREMFDYTDQIITVGNKLKSDILNEYPDTEDKLEVIFHGINTDLFSQTETSKVLDKDKYKLLSVANIDYVKGIDVLIEALHHLPEKLLSKIELTFISALIDPDYKSKCTKLIQRYGLIDHIQFLEKLPQEELVQHYHAADLFILPSRSEAFGLALAEAMATGSPCISTYSGGPEDIIRNEKVGKLVDVNDPMGLANAIDQTISNLDEYDPSKIRATITSNFSLDAKSDHLLQLYSNKINR